jgi:hypothetical protein
MLAVSRSQDRHYDADGGTVDWTPAFSFRVPSRRRSDSNTCRRPPAGGGEGGGKIAKLCRL